MVRFFNLNIFDSLYRDANFLPVNSSIRHLHISLNTPSVPLKLFHNGFFISSGCLKSSQANLKTMLLRMQMAGECRRYSINGEKSPKFILCDVLSYCFKELLKISDAYGNFVALIACIVCLSPFFQFFF